MREDGRGRVTAGEPCLEGCWEAQGRTEWLRAPRVRGPDPWGPGGMFWRLASMTMETG